MTRMNYDLRDTISMELDGLAPALGIWVGYGYGHGHMIPSFMQ